MLTNKAGIKKQALDRYVISTAEVMTYLQNQLGFQVGADFTRWVGQTKNHSYVRMRVVINPKDIVATQAQATDWAERALQENAAGIRFQDSVMETLTPYMYPKPNAMKNINPEVMKKMYLYGIYGDNLTDILTKSQLTYVPGPKLFTLFLRPEAIIRDMLTDPQTGKIVMEDPDGNIVDASIAITGVFGTTSDTIRWEVEVSKTGFMGNDGFDSINFDKLFA